MRLGQLVLDLGAVRANRDFRLVLTSRTVWLLGIGLTSVAVAVQVFQITGTSAPVALVSLTLGAGLLIGFLIGGVLADRTDRKRLVVLSSFGAAIGFAGLAANAALPEPKLWIVFVCAGTHGVIDGIGECALTAVVPAMVPGEQLGSASALLAVTTQLGAIVGPTLSGLVIAGPGLVACYCAAAAMALGTTGLLALLRPLPPAEPEPDTAEGSLREALRFLRGNRLIASLLLIDMGAMLFAMPGALYPQLASERLGGGPELVGLLYTAPAVGAFVGSVLSGWTSTVKRAGLTLVTVAALWGVAATGVGLSTNLGMVLFLLGVGGLADVFSEILRRALLQGNTPDRLQGRVGSLWLAQAVTGPSLGGILTSFGASLIGPGPAIAIGGGICVFSVLLVAALYPELRRVGALVDQGQGSR
ncbi:enterobactin transporter EntS [Actinokineospora iranica]|uniref:Multidrug efflux pump Tap n=1 Tax=Actinokineospora iranica TaxID=1271860 RepID=A0A1G6T895_9PSEU|nr:enterobactin transporter EntS [Actinokineospora iranica]SDD25268.1 MFS transporter, ENTS family, enterobactin (siderophore) exporter [Actinokineospora iranica]